MTETTNEWGQTFQEWCSEAHAGLLSLLDMGLGDVQHMCDLGDAWEQGWGVEDLARELELMTSEDLAEAFDD